MNKHSLRKIWVIISLLAALGLSLGAVNPVLAQDGDREPAGLGEGYRGEGNIKDGIISALP